MPPPMNPTLDTYCQGRLDGKWRFVARFFPPYQARGQWLARVWET